jgi:hypothetical protein
MWSQKATRREVLNIDPAILTPLRWSQVPITFPRADQWTSVRHGSPPTRLVIVPDKWVRPTRRPADLVGGPHDLLKTLQKIPQTT